MYISAAQTRMCKVKKNKVLSEPRGPLDSADLRFNSLSQTPATGAARASKTVVRESDDDRQNISTLCDFTDRSNDVSLIS